METARNSETSVFVYQTKEHHKPADRGLKNMLTNQEITVNLP